MKKAEPLIKLSSSADRKAAVNGRRLRRVRRVYHCFSCYVTLCMHDGSAQPLTRHN